MTVTFDDPEIVVGGDEFSYERYFTRVLSRYYFDMFTTLNDINQIIAVHISRVTSRGQS